MDEKKPDHLEDRRQLEHLLPIAFAFLLPYISYATALFLAFLAVIHALYISPRLVRVTTRSEEEKLGFSVGKLLYALSILVLLLLLPERIYIVAGVWALLAVGDSFSNVFGRRWGKRTLPYNSEKTMAGLLAFWIPGSLAACALIYWNRPPEFIYSFEVLLLLCTIAALITAFAESLPAAVDDNVIITWVGTLAFILLFSIENSYPQLTGSWKLALAANLTVAALAIALHWISRSGTVIAFLFGMFVYLAMGWQAYLLLCAFLALGSLATGLGRQRKEALKVAEGDGGKRGVSNVLANGVVPVLIAAFDLWIKSPLLDVAFAAAVATAALDTVATEIGQWVGGRTLDPLTFRPVKIGTPGGISLEGSGAGLTAAILLSLLCVATGWLPLKAAPLISLGALCGGLAESVIASRLEKEQIDAGFTLNIYNTLMGAFVSGLLWLNI